MRTQILEEADIIKTLSVVGAPTYIDRVRRSWAHDSLKLNLPGNSRLKSATSTITVPRFKVCAVYIQFNSSLSLQRNKFVSFFFIYF